jgi:hypothetical protein
MASSIAIPLGGSVDAGKQLQELSAKLKTVGHDGLMRKMRRNIRVAGGPVIVDLRGKVMAVKVTPGRKGGAPSNSHLRARVAGALTTSVTARRVRIEVSASKFGPYGASLPKYLDGTFARYKRWRHPVYGHKERQWAQQAGQPWFFKTVTQHSSDFRRAVLAAMDETARELEG